MIIPTTLSNALYFKPNTMLGENFAELKKNKYQKDTNANASQISDLSMNLTHLLSEFEMPSDVVWRTLISHEDTVSKLQVTHNWQVPHKSFLVRITGEAGEPRSHREPCPVCGPRTCHAGFYQVPQSISKGHQAPSAPPLTHILNST